MTNTTLKFSSPLFLLLPFRESLFLSSSIPFCFMLPSSY